MSALAVACIHCGSEKVQRDQLGDLACHACGLYQTVNGNPPKAQKDGTVMQAAPQSSDWRTVAQSQLKTLLTRMEGLDALKAEAETIAKALAVAGVIVELPWKAGGKAKAAATKERATRTFPTCTACGRQFTNTNQYDGSVKDSPVCRNGCPESQDGAAA